MSHRNEIGLIERDGSVQQIYLHHGWYGLLPLLKRVYGSEAMAREILVLGALAHLGEDLCFCPHEQMGDLMPAPGFTMAYHRDRGDELEVHVYDSFEDYSPGFDIELIAFFDTRDQCWYYGSYENGRSIKELVKA